MVESHHPLPQDVHEAMRGVSHEPIRERLLGGVASLHEVIRVDSPVTPSEAIDPASQELYRSERASARITQIADRSVTAYTQLQAEAGVEPEHTEVWRRVLQGQLAEAATARDTGQEQEAQELLGQYLATAQIAVSELPAYERDKQLKEIMAPVVKSGLGNDLVEAGRNSYGLVTVAENPDYDPFVGDPNKYVASSVAHGIESVQSALELSKGATISLDPAEASLRPMSTTAYGAKLKSASLEDRVLAHSSASLEQDGSAPERVERLKDAVITSVTEEWVDPDQYAQALSDTLDGNPHELQRHANAFAKVRLARYVGSREVNYRKHFTNVVIEAIL